MLTNELTFVWDENKNEANIKKHGLSFDIAMHVFLDPNYIDLYDENHSVDEERHIIIGFVEKIIFVVCVFQDDAIRIISCRIASKQEEEYYYDHKACFKN